MLCDEDSRVINHSIEYRACDAIVASRIMLATFLCKASSDSSILTI